MKKTTRPVRLQSITLPTPDKVASFYFEKLSNGEPRINLVAMPRKMEILHTLQDSVKLCQNQALVEKEIEKIKILNYEQYN
jgi:hypothetical protein